MKSTVEKIALATAEILVAQAGKSHVPDYVIIRVAAKYAMTDVECRQIRDILQSDEGMKIIGDLILHDPSSHP